MSAPKPIQDLRRFVERQQAALADPSERAMAMSAIRDDLVATLSVVETYLNDSRLAAEAADNTTDGEQPDQAPAAPDGDGGDGRDETP